MSTIATAKLKVEVDGAGAPIILVHGLGGSSNSFQPLLAALNGFRRIRPDLPGSARSPLPFEKLTIDVMVQAIVEAAQMLGACPAHLVGHSLGTIVCQHIAARMPEAVFSLTLFGPILEPGEAARERIRDRARMARMEGMCAVADAVVAAGLSSAAKSGNPLAAAFLRETHMRQEAESFAQTCETLAGATAADLRLIGCPVLLVTGDEDMVAPPNAVQAMAEKLKSAKVKILERCGHWTPIERPIECANLLADFVRDGRI